MNHEDIMKKAVSLTAAFIQNGDLRHDHNYRDDGSSVTHEKVTNLLIQMCRAVEEASFEAQQTSWAKRSKGDLPDPQGRA